MLESLIKIKEAERKPWKMFLIGLVYASLSLLIVHFLFPNDPLANGVTVVAFCVMFSLPFLYYMIKKEEKEDEKIDGFLHVWKVHSDAIFAFMWLFLGFIIAFSFWNIVLQNPNLLNFQVETYCRINNPYNVEECISSYSITGNSIDIHASATKTSRFFSILENNIYVTIFTLLFSLVFGAGAVFILIWNASVIAAAVGIFTKYQINDIPLGIARYMIHGFPEIASYFITALAGGILGVGIVRHGIRNKKFIRILENVVILIFLALIILLIAAFLEVYLTPILF
jgi:uncharacterized membrane protein SpoIIM required for sporulation